MARATLGADDVTQRLEGLPFLPFHFRIAGMLGFGTFFDAFDALSMSTAITMIVASLDLGYGERGVLLGAAGLGQFLGAILFGVVAERMGRKWAFVLSIALFGVCSIIASLATARMSWCGRGRFKASASAARRRLAAALFTEFVRGSARGSLHIALRDDVRLGTLHLAGRRARVSDDIWTGAWLARLVSHRRFADRRRDHRGVSNCPSRRVGSPRRGRIAEADAIVQQMENEARRLNKPLLPSARAVLTEGRTRFVELFQGIYLKRTFVVWSLEFGAYFIANGFLSWSPTLYMKIGGLPASRLSCCRS